MGLIFRRRCIGAAIAALGATTQPTEALLAAST